MSPLKLISAALVILLASIVSEAQTRVVFGRLTAFDEFPVKNVEVRSKKAKAASLSDSLGWFSVVCMKQDVLLVKSKTFKTVTRKVGPDTDSVEINLQFIDTEKNREIAVGYGYMNKDDLGDAVSQLEQENNEFCNYSDIFDVITGRFAGVDIENGQVIIRGHQTLYGSDEALYVVNGVIVNSIDWIPPCELKSISILKGSSAAVYGSRGANGVVLIEMKKAATQ